MPFGIILPIIAVTSVAALVRWTRTLLRPAGTLGLSLFRPYRGDPWPQGVQEDYEVHFDWTPRKPAPAPIQPSWSEIVVTPTGGTGSSVFEADGGEAEIEDLYGETAAIEHVHGEVHGAPH